MEEETEEEAGDVGQGLLVLSAEDAYIIPHVRSGPHTDVAKNVVTCTATQEDLCKIAPTHVNTQRQ